MAVTAEQLRAEFYYSPHTGAFLRRYGHQGMPPWVRAGYVATKGYRQLKIRGVAYRENRLAWLYTHGVWPKHQIDHRNRDPSDNRIANLRDVTQSVNKQNCAGYRNNKSGYRGVCWYAPGGVWLAQITRDGKRSHLGYFKDPRAAHDAYIAAAEGHHGRNRT